MTGRLTTAMKSALRNGSRISLASRSPATTMMALAAMTRKRMARRGNSSSRLIDVAPAPLYGPDSRTPNAVSAKRSRSSTHCRRHGQPGGGPELAHAVGLVLVRALGPDRLPLREIDRESGPGDLDGLRPQALEVHLHARRRRVPDGAVRERIEIEVRPELPVEAGEHVQVERGGHPQRIVVGELQLRLRLDEVGAEKEAIALPQPRPDRADEGQALGGVEVADVRPQERGEHGALSPPARRHPPDAVLVGRPVAGHRQVGPAGQRPRGQLERRRRHVDELDPHRDAGLHQGLDDLGELLAAARPQLDDRNRRGETGANRAGVGGQQPLLGPGDPVLGQGADRLEEPRPQRVVEIPGLKLLPPAPQIAPHVGREAIPDRHRHDVARIHREFRLASKSCDPSAS